jgi:hypothetical protein
VNYGFIASTNPGIFLLDDYPLFGSDAGINDKEEIEKFKIGFSDCRRRCIEELYKKYEQRGIKYVSREFPVDAPLSHIFPTIYTYPKCIDYFSDETKSKYNLWRIDSALLKENIPEPFVYPEHFESLPGETIYVSLGEKVK